MRRNRTHPLMILPMVGSCFIGGGSALRSDPTRGVSGAIRPEGEGELRGVHRPGSSVPSGSEPPYQEYDGHQHRHENRVEEPELDQTEPWVESSGQEGQEKPGTGGSGHPDRGEHNQ